MPNALYAELRDIAFTVVRSGRLPRSAAPNGIWNEQAAEDTFHDWLERKLLSAGDLQSMLDRSDSGDEFNRLAHVSLKQHTLNRRRRSASLNLYRRAGEILERGAFVVVAGGPKRDSKVWALSSSAQPFSGAERELLSAAWSLGDFHIIRYRATSASSSPVLSDKDLSRFINGLLGAVDAGLTLPQLLDVLAKRFDLDEPPSAESLDETAAAADDFGYEAIAFEDAARSLIEFLSDRQRTILCGRADERTLQELAKNLGCAVSTVFAEERRIADLLAEESAHGEEQELLLKKVIEVLCG